MTKDEMIKAIQDGKAREIDLRIANLSRSNLIWSELKGSDMSGADLRDSNLSNSNMSDSNLCDSDLWGADLRDSNMSGSNLRNSSLNGADLWGADLRGADLRGADLDFSCWPLWCGSLDVIIDDQQARQLAYHLAAVLPVGSMSEVGRRVLFDFANGWDGVEKHKLKKIGDNSEQEKEVEK